jgi:hypothetical protein
MDTIEDRSSFERDQRVTVHVTEPGDRQMH